MFWKMAFVALAIAAILWSVGFDFQGAKDAVTGAAQENAETLTGSDRGDWGD
jgi:hypothetical protein